MKKIIAVLFVVFCFPCGSDRKIYANNPDAILGTWLVPQKDAAITIFKHNAAYRGRISWMKFPDDLDRHNPDPRKRNTKKLGKVIMTGFVFKDNRWVNGNIYDPNNGVTYQCYIRLKDSNHLYIRGYIGITMFGRTEVWTRIR